MITNNVGKKTICNLKSLIEIIATKEKKATSAETAEENSISQHFSVIASPTINDLLILLLSAWQIFVSLYLIINYFK